MQPRQRTKLVSVFLLEKVAVADRTRGVGRESFVQEGEELGCDDVGGVVSSVGNGRGIVASHDGVVVAVGVRVCGDVSWRLFERRNGMSEDEIGPAKDDLPRRKSDPFQPLTGGSL